MSSEPEQKKLMTRYLLGELSHEERAQFEDRYLQDPDLFEQLSSAEDEMIRSYLRGDCSEEERAVLEKRVAASPDWREKVEFERSLMNHISSIPIPRAGDASRISEVETKVRPTRSFSPALPFAALAAGLVIVVIAGAWLMVTNLRLRRDLAQVQAQKLDVERRAAEFERQLAMLAARPSLAMAPLVLTTHLVRDTAHEKPLVVPAGVSSVPIQLVLERDNFPSYDAALETAEGARLWQQKDLKSQLGTAGKHVIALDLPASLLPPGTCILKLNGTSPNHKPQEVAVYIFRVAKR